MGLERIATIMQGINSIFEIDTIKNILEEVCKISGVKYGENAKYGYIFKNNNRPC